MAISAEDKNFLVSLYVGYFNRAPDPAGLQFWIDQVEAGRDTNTIAADFAASPEAKSLYPFLTTPDVSSPTSFITAVYANLFNRAPDAAGQAFWEAQLSSGAVSPADAIDAIIKGATTAPDATILANKNIVGLDFATDAGNTPGFTFDLDGTSGSAAKDAISGVTEDSATVTAAQAATDAYLSGVANIGQTFTLTEAVDNLQGTSGNDTIIAGIGSSGAVHTLGSSDYIDGGQGTDRINIRLEDNQLIPEMVNVEQVFAQALDAGNGDTLNFINTTGVEQIWTNRSTNDLAVSNVQELATVGVVEGNGSHFSVQFDVDLSGTADEITVVTDNADLATLALEGDAAADSFEVFTFQNAGDSVIGQLVDVAGPTQLTPSTITVSGEGTLDLDAVTYAGLTTVTSAGVAIEVDTNNSAETAGTDTTITSTGADDVVTVRAADGAATIAGDAAVTTIDLADGDNSVTFIGEAGLQQATITTGAGDDAIDAAMDNGEIAGSTLSISAGAGNDSIRSQLENETTETIDAGDGDDVVLLTANETLTNNTDNNGDSVDGGAGYDVLGLDSSDADDIDENTDIQSILSGFEALRVTDALVDDLDLKSFGADVNELQLDSTSGNQTVEGFTSGGTVEYRNDGNMSGTLEVVMDGATGANTPNDTLNVELNADLDGSDNNSVNLSVEGINILNVDATDRDNGDGATDQADGYTLNLSNEENITDINLTGDRALTYTASVEATALKSVDGSASEGDLGINLSAFSGTEGVDLIAGAGNDVLVGSGLSDVLVGGEGDDSLTGDAAVTVAVPGTAQENTVTFTGNLEVGDILSVTVNGTAYTYEAASTVVATELAALGNVIDAGEAAVASTSAVGNELTLVGDNDGTGFNVTAASATNKPAEAQVTDVPINHHDEAGYDEGDTIVISIDGVGDGATYVVQAGDTKTDVLNGVIAAVNADADTSGTVTASVSPDDAFAVRLTANTAGTPFTIDTAQVTDVTPQEEITEVTADATYTNEGVGLVVEGDVFSASHDTDWDTTISNFVAANAAGLAAIGITASVVVNAGTNDDDVLVLTGSNNESFTVTSAQTTLNIDEVQGALADNFDNDDDATLHLDTVNANDAAGADNSQTLTNDGVTVAPVAEITAGGQASDSLTGGAGSDTFNFAAGDSTEAAMDVITDFEAGAANADFDTLNLTSTSVLDDVILANQIDVASASVDATAGTEIGVIVENGIISLVGADAAEIDTLAEWIDVAQLAMNGNGDMNDVAAFEFGGSTYVVEEENDVATANIIKLDGTIDIVGVSTSEDSGVIHIA